MLFFCSFVRRPHRLTVRTSGSHPGNRGSIPRGVTTKNAQRKLGVFRGDLTTDENPAGSMLEGESGETKQRLGYPERTTAIWRRSRHIPRAHELGSSLTSLSFVVYT